MTLHRGARGRMHLYFIVMNSVQIKYLQNGTSIKNNSEGLYVLGIESRDTPLAGLMDLGGVHDLSLG